MQKYYQHRLSSGENNVVVALSDTECGKLFSGDTRSDLGSEAEKMRFANGINGLVVRFLRIDQHAETESEMLVMERLYPLDYRTYEVEKRELLFEVFADELKQLHAQGFVHHDIKRPSSERGLPYDNVFLTDKGIRLIDVGISALRSQVGDRVFAKYVENELQELAEFKQYFLER